MDDKAAKELYNALSAPITEEWAIQETKGKDTRKGYDTAGYAYQAIVNRLNKAAGMHGWNYDYTIAHVLEGSYQSGQQSWDITVEVSMWVGDPGIVRKAPGGHRATSYADALKGALTNGLKKVAAMYGVGKAAYEGTLDDDNLPQPAQEGRLKEVAKPTPPEPRQAPPPATRPQDPNFITVPQQKRLFAIARAAGVSDGDLRLFLSEQGIAHTDQIKKGEYERICGWAEAGGFGKETAMEEYDEPPIR